MRLTNAEVEYIKKRWGLFVKERCDQCMKPLNQAHRYTNTGKPQVYCSQECRDGVRITEGTCAYCQGQLEGKRRGSLFCNDRCRKRFARANPTSPLVRDRVKDAASPNNADNGLVVSMS